MHTGYYWIILARRHDEILRPSVFSLLGPKNHMCQEKSLRRKNRKVDRWEWICSGVFLNVSWCFVQGGRNMETIWNHVKPACFKIPAKPGYRWRQEAWTPRQMGRDKTICRKRQKAKKQKSFIAKRLWKLTCATKEIMNVYTYTEYWYTICMLHYYTTINKT